MKSFTVAPGRPLAGTITVPGDKSVTHRAIIMTALAEGESRLSSYCRGEDCLNTMRAFQAMGIQIEEQPDVLPSALPNMLVNGAVGMCCGYTAKACGDCGRPKGRSIAGIPVPAPGCWPGCWRARTFLPF